MGQWTAVWNLQRWLAQWQLCACAQNVARQCCIQFLKVLCVVQHVMLKQVECSVTAWHARQRLIASGILMYMTVYVATWHCILQGVPTEREVHTIDNASPVYRVLLTATRWYLLEQCDKQSDYGKVPQLGQNLFSGMNPTKKFSFAAAHSWLSAVPACCGLIIFVNELWLCHAWIRHPIVAQYQYSL